MNDTEKLDCQSQNNYWVGNNIITIVNINVKNSQVANFG